MSNRVQQFRKEFRDEASYKLFVRVVLGLSFLSALLFASVIMDDPISAAPLEPEKPIFSTKESSGQGGAADKKGFIIIDGVKTEFDIDGHPSLSAHPPSHILHVEGALDSDIGRSMAAHDKAVFEAFELVPYEQAVEIEPREITEKNQLLVEVSALRRDILTLRHEIKILNSNIERE